MSRALEDAPTGDDLLARLLGSPETERNRAATRMLAVTIQTHWRSETRVGEALQQCEPSTMFMTGRASMYAVGRLLDDVHVERGIVA